MGRSVIEYAAPAWIPWISKTNLENLEAAQRYAARAVTGQLKTTPAEAILIESDLPSIKTRSRQLAISAFDKALRLPEDNPRHGVATREEGIRTKKTDWRDHSRKLWRDIFEGREPDCVESLPCLRPPWEEGPKMSFERSAERKSESVEENRMAAERALNDEQGKWSITCYTDGSAEGAVRNGGAGVLAVFADERDHVELSVPAGSWTSSFQAEMVAIREALSLIMEESQPQSAVRIVTDSLSSWERLQSMQMEMTLHSGVEADIADYLREIGRRGVEVGVLWCPSHCGVWGNERADRLGAVGADMEQGGAKWSFETARAAIRRGTRDRRMHKETQASIYENDEGYTIFPRDKGLSRQEQVTLCRVRSGHHPDVRYWRKKLGLSETHICRLCEMAVETTLHVLGECPAMRHLYPSDWRPRMLIERPEKTLEIWSRWQEAVPF